MSSPLLAVLRKGRSFGHWECLQTRKHNFTLRNTRCPFYFRSAPPLGSLSILSSPYTPVRRLIARLMRSRTDDDDPLTAALTPPQDETSEARAIRLSREEEARRVSEAIDESIRAERQMNKKHKIVRILLLGQSESGARYFRSLS